MRTKILAGLAVAALSAVPAAAAPSPALLLDSGAAALARAAADAQQGGVRVWMDGWRDVYHRGDRMRVNVRTDYDAYVAVFHIDTNGDVDVLYPRSEHDDGWMQRGRTLRLGSRGWDYLRARGGYGMGYVVAVALDEPLEMWRVRDLYRPRLAGWSSDRTIWGDPFYAIDELIRAVVPEGAYGYESVDYYTYHVGGRRYTHPRYACYDGFGDWYYDYGYTHYGTCDRVRVVLVNRPYYYDTYRWRGSRRVYYEDYYYRTARNRPLHGYKERTSGQAAPPARSSTQRRPAPARGGAADTRPGQVYGGDRPDGARTGGGGARPEPRRDSPAPSDARRPDVSPRTSPDSRPDRGEAQPRVRTGAERPASADQPRVRSGGDRPEARQPQPRDESARSAPRQDTPARPERDRPSFQRRPPSEPRSEPRRESPPQRSAEPRRESSPPQRSAEPRRESPPPQRSAEPRRESPPPQRSAEPRAAPRRESSDPPRRERDNDPR